jgi:hypothetical protein
MTVLKLNHKIQSPNNRKIEFFKMQSFESGNNTVNQHRSSIQKNLGYLLNKKPAHAAKKKPPVAHRTETDEPRTFETVMNSRLLLK